MKRPKLTFYLLILILYIMLGFLITGFGALILGFADYPLIVIFGIINVLIADFYFKINSLRSIFLGFLISSAGLTFSYLLWMPMSNFNFADDVVIMGFLSNAIFQLFSWQIVEKFIVQKDVIKTITLFLTMMVVTFISFNVNDYWRFEKYYNWNKKKKISLHLINSETGESMAGDSIRIFGEKQLLYGIMASLPIEKSIIDSNGFYEFEVYLGNNYHGWSWQKNQYTGSHAYFEIHSYEIARKDTIEIKNNH